MIVPALYPDPARWLQMPTSAIGIDSGKVTGWGVVEVRRRGPGPDDGLVERVLGHGVLDADAPRHLVELIREYRPDLMGLEIVKHVHQVRRGGVNGISTVQALNLYQAGLVAGDLRATARHHGLLVLEHGVEDVRGALAGKRTADDAEVEHALRLRLAGFPAPRKSNNHERDGLAVGLYALLGARMKAHIEVAAR